MKITETQKTFWEQDGQACVETTQIVEHNLNYYWQVELTEDGVNLWRTKRWARIEKGFDFEVNPEKTTERFNLEFAAEMKRHHIGNGWYEFQVHALLGLFGSLFHEGMAFASPLPFKTDYKIVEKKMEIVDMEHA